MPIVAIPRRELSKFERMYFLEAESDGRTNIRKITIGDDGRTRVNGNETNSDDIATDETDIDSGDTDTRPDDDSTGNDDNDIALEPDDDMGDDETDEGNPKDTGDADTSPPDENVDGGGDRNDVALEPDDNDDLDSQDSSENDSGEDTAQDATDVNRKRALFSRIDGLYETMEKYTEKLNMLMSNAADDISMYRIACDDLDDLKVCTYDYLIVRFSKASYMESMLFYQRVLTALRLILDDLGAAVSALRSKKENEQKTKDKPLTVYP